MGIKCGNLGRVAQVVAKALEKHWFPASTLSGLTASKVSVLGSLGQRQPGCTTLKQTHSHKYRPRMIPGSFDMCTPCPLGLLAGTKHWVGLVNTQWKNT